jgi:hypothetical protein
VGALFVELLLLLLLLLLLQASEPACWKPGRFSCSNAAIAATCCCVYTLAGKLSAAAAAGVRPWIANRARSAAHAACTPLRKYNANLSCPLKAPIWSCILQAKYV